jgi:23S rRNA pseudouridine2605 synthase
VIKKVIVTTGLKARGYVDGRYVGEEKPESRRGDRTEFGKKKRGKPAAGAKKRGRKQGGSLAGDNIGNQLPGAAATPGTPGAKRGRRGRGKGQAGQAATGLPIEAGQAGPANKRGSGNARRNRAGKKTPFRPAAAQQPSFSVSEVAEMRRMGGEARSGQFAEALAKEATVKRERLHKVMAQSGIGSRRDMELMISMGRVMVNGIVATAGTAVAPDDKVLVDGRPVVLKFSQDLPRVLLYHKPEGEIVTTNDPGNRITVFDNLPKVENGKWINIGRLDINTSGLLIFTTNGELANRFMHPRYEVEREYAVRLLGELTGEQEAKLLAGLELDFNVRQGEDGEEDREESSMADFPTDDEEAIGNTVAPANTLPANHHLAKLERIERREGEEGEGANHWYHVVIKEGRNREVRRLFEAVGLTVSRLMRTRYGGIILPPQLRRGMMAELTPDQVRKVLIDHGMSELAGAPEGGGRRGQRNLRSKASQPHAGLNGNVQPGAPREGGRGPRNPGPNRGRRPQRGLPVEGNETGISEFEMAAMPQGEGAPNSQPGAEQAEGPRDPRRRNRRRNRRGKKPVAGGETAGNVSAQSHAAGGEGGDDIGNRVTAPPGPQREPGAPRDPNAPRRKRPRRNFRNRNRRNQGGGEGGPPQGGAGGGEPAAS